MDGMVLTVLMMAVVTYIPRMLPMVVLSSIKLPAFINSVFRFIPFAALGALIFPGIIFSTGTLQSAIAGAIVAIALAYYRANVVIVVIGSIIGVFLWQMF